MQLKITACREGILHFWNASRNECNFTASYWYHAGFFHAGFFQSLLKNPKL